jgi:hypothetical protein
MTSSVAKRSSVVTTRLPHRRHTRAVSVEMEDDITESQFSDEEAIVALADTPTAQTFTAMLR